MTEEKKTVEDTPTSQEPSENKPVDWEKRYKDAQSELTKKSQELKATAEEYSRDKELLDQVTPYIDWKALNGSSGELEDDDGYVSKKEMKAQIAQIKKSQDIARITLDFRRKYPDMIDYEDQVGFYLQNKTDPRHKMADRIEKAVEYTKNFLEAERKKGITSAEAREKEAKAKEAEVSGLKAGGQTSPPKEDDGVETEQDYVNYLRRNRAKKTTNY